MSVRLLVMPVYSGGDIKESALRPPHRFDNGQRVVVIDFVSPHTGPHSLLLVAGGASFATDVIGVRFSLIPRERERDK